MSVSIILVYPKVLDFVPGGVKEQLVATAVSHAQSSQINR